MSAFNSRGSRYLERSKSLHALKEKSSRWHSIVDMMKRNKTPLCWAHLQRTRERSSCVQPTQAEFVLGCTWALFLSLIKNDLCYPYYPGSAQYIFNTKGVYLLIIRARPNIFLTQKVYISLLSYVWI